MRQKLLRIIKSFFKKNNNVEFPYIIANDNEPPSSPPSLSFEDYQEIEKLLHNQGKIWKF